MKASLLALFLFSAVSAQAASDDLSLAGELLKNARIVAPIECSELEAKPATPGTYTATCRNLKTGSQHEAVLTTGNGPIGITQYSVLSIDFGGSVASDAHRLFALANSAVALGR